MFSAYPEIRLGLLRFHANVQESDEKFWSYMNVEVLPRVRSAIEGKEWSEITGIKGSRAAYKAFGRNPGRYRVSSEALIRRVRRGDEFCGEAWDAVSRYVYTALQGGSIMKGWTNDDRMMIACCNDGTRPVIFKIERIDIPENNEEAERLAEQDFKNSAEDAYTG